MALDDSQFEQLASNTLDSLMEQIDEILGDILDVEMQNGILTLELDNGGQYVINKHLPNRQIWMSSPKSGATHYDYDGTQENWVSTRGGALFLSVLSEELTAISGQPITL